MPAVLVAETSEGGIIAALPASTWHRTAARRVLPRELVRKVLAARVLLVSPEDRSTPLGEAVRVWLAILTERGEASVDLVRDFEEDVSFSHTFGGSEAPDLVPSAASAVEAASALYEFQTGESGLPVADYPASASPLESRVAELESCLTGLRDDMKILLERGKAPPPPPSPAPSRATTTPTAVGLGTRGRQKFEGLDPGVVQAALSAGVEQAHLEEMAKMVKSQRGLRDQPLQGLRPRATKVIASPLDDEDEDDDDPPGEPAASASQDPVHQAIGQLTSIASQLALQKKKDSSLEALLDGGAAGSADSSTSSGTGSRRNAAALRLLKERLLTKPREVSQVLERNLEADFALRSVCPSGPGQCSSLAGNEVESAELPRDDSIPLGRRRGSRCAARRTGRRMLCSPAAPHCPRGPDVDRPRVLVAGGGSILGGCSSVCCFQQPHSSVSDRASVHQASGRALDRAVPFKASGHRDISGAEAEVGERGSGSSEDGQRGRAGRRQGRQATPQASKGRRSRPRARKPGGRQRQQMIYEAGELYPESLERDVDKASPSESASCKVPGSSASSICPAALWRALPRIFFSGRNSFSSFARSQTFIKPTSTSCGFTSSSSPLWPMRLPYPGAFKSGWSDTAYDSEENALQKAVNLAVLLLNWLALGRPKHAPPELSLLPPSTGAQRAVVRRLESMMREVVLHPVVAAEDMGRVAAKVEDLESLIASFEEETPLLLAVAGTLLEVGKSLYLTPSRPNLLGLLGETPEQRLLRSPLLPHASSSDLRLRFARRGLWTRRPWTTTSIPSATPSPRNPSPRTRPKLASLLNTLKSWLSFASWTRAADYVWFRLP